MAWHKYLSQNVSFVEEMSRADSREYQNRTQLKRLWNLKDYGKHMLNEFQCQMLVPNEKHILLIYLLSHISRRRQKWAKQVYSRVDKVLNILLQIIIISIKIWINKNLLSCVTLQMSFVQ